MATHMNTIYLQRPLIGWYQTIVLKLSSSRVRRNDFATKLLLYVWVLGCEPKKIWMIIRHGTRNPSDKQIELMRTRLPQLRSIILSSKNVPNGMYSLFMSTLKYLSTTWNNMKVQNLIGLFLLSFSFWKEMSYLVYLLNIEFQKY